MSYRLCEAALNNYISGDQYVEKIDKLMVSTRDLLEIQLKTTQAQKEKLDAEIELENVKAANR